MKSAKPKVLHGILGRPACTYPLSRALELGASPVVVVVGHEAEQVKTAIKATLPEAEVRFAVQAEQNGTAHAVRCAEEALASFQGSVLILYGDVPLLRKETLAQLSEAFEASGSKLAFVTTTPPNPRGYGRVQRENGLAVRVVEQKDCSLAQNDITECNAGIYLVESEFLWKSLREVKSSNAQREFYLTDLIELSAKAGGAAAVRADFAETAGINDRVELAACAKVMQLRINEQHMRAGVSLQDPGSTFIDEDVEIGADTEVGPQVRLERGSRLGKNVQVGQGCVVTASKVADGVVLRPYSVLEEASVGQGSLIGPFARLRPGTELSEGVHIGNFVETKKTRMGKGSKANHLAYLGDADIGRNVNVGAGTITCNYDGVNKHKTTLGDGVFIGSDTQLIAPVTVGDGAYVGAGTTVTVDVPANALAVSRAPQKNIEGWAEKKRAKQAAEQASRAGPASSPTKLAAKAG